MQYANTDRKKNIKKNPNSQQQNILFWKARAKQKAFWLSHFPTNDFISTKTFDFSNMNTYNTNKMLETYFAHTTP
jgi:hypothetical protein